MAKKILNVHFQDVNDKSKAYKIGDDVSHIKGDSLEFLTKNGYITDGKDDDDDTSASAGAGTGAGATAKEIIAQIGEAGTVAEVDALIAEGESRKSILSAAEKRKAELGQA